MNAKIVTGILLILLLTNLVTTTFNVTEVFAFTGTPTKTTNAIDDLLKGVNFNEKTQNTEDSALSESMNFWDFNQKDQENTQTDYWSTNSTEVVVGLADTWAAYAKVEQLALAKNGKIVNKVLMGNKVEAIVVNVPLDSIASFTTELKENKLSKYAEPNQKYQAFMTPNDQYWDVQWGPKKIQADYAWNTTTGSSDILVCVIDTGIDYTHPDLAANYVHLGYDWVNSDSDPIDDNGHGTHCAGIIGAVINNNIGIAGLAQIRFMAEKGLDAYGSGYEDDLANAIINATDEGANILSMSWGGSGSSTLIYNALKYAYDKGVLLVAAAGNSGSSARLYPASYEEVIAVTATDPDDYLANFSTYGDWVEIAAPGVEIYSTISAEHDSRFNYPYDYLSGTSMACPHVAGVAALVWSRFPYMARDVLRLHLLDTADDLGSPGFDIYYGYGRLNARRALEESLPERDIFIAGWRRPPYVEPNSVGKINATIVNYGRYNETGVTAEILINGSVEQSTSFDLLRGASATINLSWAPTIKGTYNVTVYVLPVVNETNLANNIVQGYVTVDYPLKAFVLRSAGTQVTTDAWDVLNYNWKKFGNKLIYIDYAMLDKDNITYADLSATGADVIILSCSYAWEYADGEIEAVKQYVYEGHGFIATAGTFYYAVPNNNKFAPMFGIDESIQLWTSTNTDLLNLSDPLHPLFSGVPNPYTMPAVGTAYPYSTGWTPQTLVDGTYVAMGFYGESAIVVNQGLVYISPWLEVIPEQYKFNLQVLYNAITWSQYRKPEHELRVSLDAPSYLFPDSDVVLNATVTNEGLQNESDATLQLSVYDMTRNMTVISYSQYIPMLLSGDSYTLSVPWHPALSGLYNATVYAPPVAGENATSNNKATVLVNVAYPLIRPQEGQWARYSVYFQTTSANMDQQPLAAKLLLNYSKYISPYMMNVTMLTTSGSNNTTDWTVVNIIDRYCESGVWEGMWFPGMIETNITLSSSVRLLSSPATVIGSEVVAVGRKVVDCWKLYQGIPGSISYTWWYDKTDGLWIKLDVEASSPQIREIIVLEETNIPTGFTPEHELFVELEAPSFIALGDSSLLGATVSNYGLHNESNVELMLEINGAIVNSSLIAKLPVNESYTISYSWTPSAEATYNVTAHSPWALGENITSDNTVTAMVEVRAVKGRVLVDQTHGTDSISLYNTWIESVRDLGYLVDSNYVLNITSDVLKDYDVFVILQAQSWYSSKELQAIRDFVAKGGGLLVVGDDQPNIYTDLTSFANISWIYGGMGGYTQYIFRHEVTEGVYTVYLYNPDAMMNIGGGTQALVRDAAMEIMLAVNWYGRGRVMGFADEECLNGYGIGVADNLRLATNVIAWLCRQDATSPEILFLQPSNGTLIGTTTVTVHWGANDSQSGVGKYSVYRNGLFVANTTSDMYIVSSLVEGSNNITIIAYDRVGNSASRGIIIIVDITAPTIHILAPADNSSVSGLVTVWVGGVDRHSARLELYIDLTRVATFNITGVSGDQPILFAFNYTWDTTSDLYGNHSILLIGRDVVGNSAIVGVTVMVDNILPTVAIISPTNNTYTHGNLTISFIAQDLELKNASIIIGGTIIIDVTGSTSLVFDTATLIDGSYAIKLIAYDMAENKAETSITVIVDNTLPSAEIVAPANAAYVKGVVNVTFTFADSNLEKATLSIDWQSVDVTTLSFYHWDTTNQSDGSRTLTLTVSDKAGNTQTDVIAVTVDNTQPIGEIRTPSNGTYQKWLRVTFYGYDAKLANIKLYLNDDNVIIGTLNVSGTYLYAGPEPDGLYDVKLEVYDKAGNLFTTTITVTVDNTLPTAALSSPSVGAYVKGTVRVNFTFADVNLENATLQIDGQDVINVLPTAFYLWDTTGVTDGNHTLTLKVWDKAENTKTVQTSLIVDNTQPTAAIQSPTNSAQVKSMVSITFAFADLNLERATLSIDGQSVDVTTASSYLWNTNGESDRSYSLRLSVWDKAGNTKTNEISVILDNTLPTARIDSPSNGATVSGTVTISHNSSDNNQYSLSLFIDSVGIIIDPHQAYQWDTTKVVDGNHTIRLVATDMAGNTRERVITVNVANAQPAYVTYTEFAAAGFLGLALGAVIVWLLLKRKPTPTTS